MGMRFSRQPANIGNAYRQSRGSKGSSKQPPQEVVVIGVGLLGRTFRRSIRTALRHRPCFRIDSVHRRDGQPTCHQQNQRVLEDAGCDDGQGGKLAHGIRKSGQLGRAGGEV